MSEKGPPVALIGAYVDMWMCRCQLHPIQVVQNSLPCSFWFCEPMNSFLSSTYTTKQMSKVCALVLGIYIYENIWPLNVGC